MLSSNDDLTHDLHTVNVNNNNIEILPHTRHFEATQTFCSITFTRAECKNVHGKWKDLLRNKTFHSILESYENKGLSKSLLDKKKRFVSEVDIKVAPFDIVIANEVWVPFFKMVTYLLSMHIPPAFLSPNNSLDQKSRGLVGLGCNNNTLPLIYVKAKTIRILLLTKSKEDCRNPDKIDLNHAALNPDMTIFKCDSISITPQVENMLSRILVQPELFHLSRDILSIPGSQIEDRQYQLDAIGLGLFTGRWCDIERKSEKRPKSLLKTMGENPALEWNDGTITNEAEKKVDEVFLMPCVAPFDLQITFAPAIVYETLSFADSAPGTLPISSEKLIAGMSLEINAKSEIVFATSLNQVGLMSLFIQESITIYNSLLYPPTSGGSAKTPKVPDSGIDGDEASKALNETEQGLDDVKESAFPSIVPLELLITGSKISFILFKLTEGNKSMATKEDKAMWRKYRYKHRRCEIKRDRKEEYPLDLESEEAFTIDSKVKNINDEQYASSSTGYKCDVGYEASEEGSVEESSDLVVKIFPLLCCLINQPHMFFSYTKPRKNRLELSVYDTSVNLSPVNYFITCGGHRVPGTLDYQNQLFQTKLGQPDPKSGIPPALLTFTAKDFLAPSVAKLCLKIERPIKIHCSMSLWNQFFNIISSIKEACGIFEITQLMLTDPDNKRENTKDKPTAEEEDSVILIIRKYLANVEDISFDTKQVVASIPTSIHQTIAKSQKDDFAEANFSVAGIEAKCKVVSKYVNSVNLASDISCHLSSKKIFSRLSIGTYCHPFFGPSTIQIKANALWQDTCIKQDPSLTIKLESDVIAVHIGPNQILSLIKLNQYLQKQSLNQDNNSNGFTENDVTNKITSSLFEEKKSVGPKTEINFSKDIKCENQKGESHEQNYVDDLRAGAFQYVDDVGNSLHEVEPKPYQVIFSKNPPAMTWKYPQPRTLTRVSIFPVPLKVASELGSANIIDEQEVACVLQYFDKCANVYRTYSEFNLSEQNVCHLDLPLAKDLKKMVMASTWRVVLDIQDEYEDFDQLERQIIVTPKSLVSVIRVDSYVNEKLVPRVQTSIKISQFALHLHNHLHFCGYSLPIPTGPKFNLDQVFPLDQKICSLQLDGTTCGLDIWLPNGFISSNWLATKDRSHEIQLKSRIDTQLQVQYVDYSFLSNHHLFFPCQLHLKCFATQKKDNPMLIESELHAKKILVRVGHFFSRTLSISKDIWEAAFNNSYSAISENGMSACQKQYLIPMTDYVICNNTQESIRFGQADTDENILLRPSEAHMYAWRSQRTRLQLRLCVEGLGYWRWCESFELSYGEENALNARFRAIDHGTHITTLVITMKKMSQAYESSCSQYHVIVSGLISTASLLRDHLEVRAVLHKHGAALAAAATVSSTSTHDHHQQQHRTILGSFCVAPSFLLQPDYVQGIKIRLLGIGTPWSGDIPLSIEKGRRNSVLVRVPLKEKGQCLTIWCRLVEEKLGNGTIRCLLIFSPMYMSRSLLPNPISVLVYLAASGTQKPASTFTHVKENDTFSYEVTLPGKEETVQLETTGASDQKYNLLFQVVPGLPPSDPVTMSWGTIEKIRNKTYETPSIDEVLSEITKYAKSATLQGRYTVIDSKPFSKIWPYLNEDFSNIEWAPSAQPRTDVQVRFVQFHPLCNTLCVEVVPWCLMVNMTGVTVLIKDENSRKDDKESSIHQIANKSVFVPPTAIVTSVFHIGLIDDDGKEWFSPPLQMTNQQWNFQRRSILMPSLDGMIPVDGLTHTYVVCGGQICYLTIQSHDENGIRVLNIKPKFKISNCLAKSISVASICTLKKELSCEDYVNFLGQDLAATSSKSNVSGVKAEPMLYWQMLGNSNEKDVYATGLQQVAFCISPCWSNLLNLGNCIDLEHDIRISVSLPNDTNCVDGRNMNEETHAAGEVINELIFVSLHQRQGSVYLVLQNDNQPQFVIHNNVNLPICFIEQETGLNRYNLAINQTKIIHRVAGQKSYLYSSVFASSNLPKVESMDSAIQIAFSVIPENNSSNEGKLLNQSLPWSEWFDISNSNKYLHEYYIRIPGYGDVAIHLEPLGNTVHVYIQPISEMEIPAKEIRSRILASSQNQPLHEQSPTDANKRINSAQLISSPATSDESELLETSTNGEESFVTIPTLDKSKAMEDKSFLSVNSPAATVYGSCDNSFNPQTSVQSGASNEIYATAFFDEICFVLR